MKLAKPIHLDSEQERKFWARVRVDPGGCWQWRGGVDVKGYGRLTLSGAMFKAHRTSKTLANGRQLTANLELDHLCRNRLCVRPDHLEEVTAGTNQKRGMAPIGLNHQKTRCSRGHSFPPQSLYYNSKGWRCCKRCKAELKKCQRMIR